MIHYTCDRCRRTLDSRDGSRYAVHIDVEVIQSVDAAVDPDALVNEESVDYLNELHELLQGHSGREHQPTSANGFAVENDESLDLLHELLLRGDELDGSSLTTISDCQSPSGNELMKLPPVSLPPVTTSSPTKSFQNTPHAINSDFEDESETGCTASYDLCPTCYAKFSKNPLSREREFNLHFSNN